MVSAKQMENISKGLSPKIWQEHKVGQFQFFGSELLHEALWVRIYMLTFSQGQWTRIATVPNFAVSL